jgi:hypothetical protein
MIVLLGLGLQVKAQAPCAEVVQLRNAANAGDESAVIGALRSFDPSFLGHGGDAEVRGQQSRVMQHF